MRVSIGCCLPHLRGAAACGGSALGDPVWPKAHPGQSSLFCKELWRCPRSTEHTWQTARGEITLLIYLLPVEYIY